MAEDLIDDEQYASSEDSDFAPDAAPAQDSDQSDSEPDGADGDRPSKRRRTAEKGDGGEDKDAGYDNSGDEAIIKKGEKKKKKRKDKSTQDGDEEDEGGEGGLIKTRRQRAAEYVCRSPK